MDFVTHAAVGALAGRAVARPAAGRSLMAAGAIAALVPDADHALELWSGEAYLVWHRTLTHGLLFCALAVAAAAALPARGPVSRGARAAAVAAALATHLLLDLLTPFPTAIFAPFSSAGFHLDGLPLVAPLMIGLSLALFGLVARAERSAPEAARSWALLGLATLGAVLAAEHAVARGAEVHAAARGFRPLLAAPRPLAPLSADVFCADEVSHRLIRVGASCSGAPGVLDEVALRIRGVGPGHAASGDAASIALSGLPPSVGGGLRPPGGSAAAPRPSARRDPCVLSGRSARVLTLALEGRADVARLLGRFRVPVSSLLPDGRVAWSDFQFAAYAPEERWPFRIVATPPGGDPLAPAARWSVEVVMSPRGVQFLLWVAVFAATVVLARRGTSSSEEGRNAGS